MKSLFFVFIGAIPLAVLTFLAFGNILMVRGWRPEINAAHFSQQMSVAQQTSDDLRSLRSVPIQLAKGNLIGYPLPDGVSGMRQEVPLWGSTPRLLRSWSEIVGCSERLMKAHRNWESDDISNLVQIKSQIREFRNVLSEEKEFQGKALKLLARMDKELDWSIEEKQKKEEVKKILVDARNALDREDWQLCSTLSQRLKKEFEPYVSEVKVDLDIMINRCAFHLAESGVEMTLNSGSSDSQYEELQAFLNQVESPDQLTETERKSYDNWKLQLGKIRGGAGSGVRSGGASSSGSTQTTANLDAKTQEILKPFYAASKSFPSRVREASRILVDNDTPAVRGQLKEEILKLIRQGVPE